MKTITKRRTPLPVNLQGKWTRVGWTPPRRKVPLDEWESLVLAAVGLRGALQWCIGDLLNYGESTYGEDYAQASATWMLEVETLYNYAWVCRRIDISRRRESLPFTVHQVVAPLEEQDQDTILYLAETNNWTRERVRQEVKEWGLTETYPALLNDPDQDPTETIEMPLETASAMVNGIREAVETVRDAEQERAEAKLWALRWKAAALRYRKFYKVWKARALRLEEQLEAAEAQLERGR